VILFEAIYFLPDVARFLDEARQVLASGGRLLIATVNPSWTAFNPSPYATRYWTAGELDQVLQSHGFATELYVGFPASEESFRGQIVDRVKRVFVKLHLMPKTMRGKELLKRVAFGKLEPFPAEVSATTGAYTEPIRLADLNATGDSKILYAVARKEDRNEARKEDGRDGEFD
jgi:hypothetical protein